MTPDKKSFTPVLRTATAIISAMAVPALIQVWQLLIEKNKQKDLRFLVLLLFSILLVLLFNLIAWSKKSQLFDVRSIRPINLKLRIPVFLGILFALLIPIHFLFFRNVSLTPYITILLDVFWVRFLVLTFGFFLLDWILWVIFEINPWKTFNLLVLIAAACWQVLRLIPSSISYPFSLDWSETSWYYYSSFFYAKRLYGTAIPWPFLDIGKPLLLSIVYLTPHTPLWLIRIWQFVLWMGVPALIAWLFWRRTKPEREISTALFLWFFVWVLLGPVYFHLGLAVALVVWKYNRKRLWNSILWIAIASLWSGMLRVNWIPVPAILALAFYFLESPKTISDSLSVYLKQPALVAISGLAAGVAGFIGYALLSGRLDTRFTSKLTAPFLWYRLWPNATLQTGIVLGVLIVSAVVIIIIWRSWRSLIYSPLRIIFLSTMAGILFLGGTFASLKIGGGNNLHNLDAFLVFMMVWGGYAMSDRIQSENTGRHYSVSVTLVSLLCLATSLWSLQGTLVFNKKNIDLAQNDLAQIRQITQAHSNKGESVLFITQRQLLTFGMISDVQLVPEYELLELMEMAMTGNQAYLQGFKNDLKFHRFGLIVMNVETGEFQEQNESFAAENNAWVSNVYLPIMKYYDPILTFPESGIVIYIPD